MEAPDQDRLYPAASVLPASLRTLRITVDQTFFGDTFDNNDGEIEYKDGLLKSLVTITSLENLTITVYESYRTLGSPKWQPSSPSDNGRKYMAHRLFDAFKEIPNLGHVALLGSLAFSQTCFLNFIKHNATSLRRLIIYGCVLNGHWSHVLPEIADFSCSKLEYLSILFSTSISEPGQNGYYDISWYDPSDVPHFDCVTNFSDWTPSKGGEDREDEGEDGEHADDEVGDVKDSGSEGEVDGDEDDHDHDDEETDDGASDDKKSDGEVVRP